MLQMSPIFFFFNHTATTEIYTLSLHDALPILGADPFAPLARPHLTPPVGGNRRLRSEEHTSELQSHSDLVCRLLLEKKKKKISTRNKGAGGNRGSSDHHAICRLFKS